MNVLLIAEYEGDALRIASVAAVGMANDVAQTTGGTCDVLLLGADASAAAEDAARYAPVLVAEHADLSPATADCHAAVIAEWVNAKGYDVVVGAATTYGKDTLGRAAGLLGGYMASDVVGHDILDGELLLKRPMFAGSVNATVKLLGGPRVVTVRSSAYDAPTANESASPITTVEVTPQPARLNVNGVASKTGGRPDVTEAAVVVSGGRAWKTSEDFENNVGKLADTVGGAAGSSRVLVDAGITPNELQVGQTGKIVAPDLYLALGISGAVQHLAGMKNSKVIAAINSDKDAPIFQVADFGLVGDVYKLTPQLIEKLAGTCAGV
ncbi:electron transfer flavoprotein subunit alpha/FixB family protein [Phycisphaeraceae bacterium D3-23]